MVERLGIAVGKGLEVGAVENALGDQLGEDHEQAVGVGDGAGDQRLVDHRQPLVLASASIFFIDHGAIVPPYALVAQALTPANSPSAAHASRFVASGRVLAALDDGRSISARLAFAEQPPADRRRSRRR